MDSEENETRKQRRSIQATYIISAIGAILQYAVSLTPALLGLFFITVAGFMIKRQRRRAKDSVYESHVEWMARTQKIGLGLFFPLSLVLAVILCYLFADGSGLAAMLQGASAGDIGKLAGQMQTYIAKYSFRINVMTGLSVSPVILWWLWRYWHGFSQACRGNPVEQPRRWI